MAGKYHYTVSANYCNVEHDTIEGLADKLRDFVNHEEIPVLLEQFAVVSKVPAPTLGQAITNAKSSLGASEVKADKPAPPAPVAQTESGDMRVVSTKYPDKFFIYDHPKAILTPKGTKAILLWARSSNGKPYTKWVDEDIAERGMGQREGWGEMTEWGFDTSDLPVLANS